MAPVTSGEIREDLSNEVECARLRLAALIACCDSIVAVFMRDAPFSLRT